MKFPALFHAGALFLSTSPSVAAVSLTGTAIVDPISSDGRLLDSGRLALIIVDRSQNGFAASADMAIAIGDDISMFVSALDDVVIAANASFSELGFVGIGGGADFDLGNGIDPGDPFGIVFFDNLDAGSSVATQQSSYGFATDPTWVVPAEGASVGYSGMSGAGTVQQLSGLQADKRVASYSGSISYAAWRLNRFNSSSSLEGERYCDPDGDELDNLFEYAFDTDPLRVTILEFPKVEQDPSSGNAYLVAEYTRPTSHDEVTVSVAVSENLADWHESADYVKLVERHVHRGEEHVRYRSSSAPESRLFMQITVSESE